MLRCIIQVTPSNWCQSFLKVLLPPPSFLSENIKWLLTNSGHCQAREFQMLTRPLLPRPVWPSRAGRGHPFMGTIARRCGRALGSQQSVPSSAFANSLRQSNQKTFTAFASTLRGWIGRLKACNIYVVHDAEERSHYSPSGLGQQRDILGTSYSGYCGRAIWILE